MFYSTTPGDDKKTAALLLQAVCLYWLLAKIIGWKVWIKERLFPLVPIFDFLDIPSWQHFILFACSLTLLVLLIFKPLNKALLATLLIEELLSCLADQSRLQPWEYQYLFIVFLYIINLKDYKKIFICISFIMVATYFYSGCSKLNESYLVVVWDNMFLKFFHVSASFRKQDIIHYSGYLTAIFESLFGILLLFRTTKKIAAWGLILMHLTMLVLLGPFGLKYNVSIWPFNLLMIVFLYILFIRNKIENIIMPVFWKGWNILVLICWGILPTLNYVGLWDNYLSCSLYSGRIPIMVLCIKDSIESGELKMYINKTDSHNMCNGNAMVNVQNWSLKEMNVPCYPELRVYKKLKEYWQNKHKESNTVFFYYLPAKEKEAKSF